MSKHTHNPLELIDNCFTGLVGQENSISTLKTAAKGFANGGRCLSVLALAAAGMGKTRITGAYMDALEVAQWIRGGCKGDISDKPENSLRYASPEEFRLNGEEYGTLANSIENMRPLFLGLDEVADFAKRKTVQTEKIWTFIKKALDGNGFSTECPKGDKFVKWEDTAVNVTKSNFCVIAATNFPEKVPDRDAMLSRFKININLTPYNEGELTEILSGMLKASDITANEQTIGIIARTGRGTARPLEDIVAHMESVIMASGKKTRTINRDEVVRAMRELSLYPQGLKGTEVYILSRCIGSGFPIAALAMMTGKEEKEIRRSITYLQSKDFIGVRGRAIVTAPKGQRYLEVIKGEKFIIPANVAV